MKFNALLMCMLLTLSGCGSAPKPVQMLEACPKVPPLELDVPERAWQDQMRAFLAGTLPMQPDYSLRSTSAGASTQNLNER